MNRILLVSGIIAVLITALIWAWFAYTHAPVETQYYEKAMVYGGHFFSNIVEVRGEPIRREMEKNDGYYHHKLIYDGYVYSTTLSKYLNTDPYFSLITITDPEYRIGKVGIGVGSTREDVERVYKYAKKIRDMPPGQIGFIEGLIWVSFYLSPEETVKEIHIVTDGP